MHLLYKEKKIKEKNFCYNQIAEWATRAFFKYGESVSHHPSQAGTPGNPAEPSITQGGSYVASPGVRQGFNSPGVVTSTPHPGGVGQAVVRAEVIRSSKYDGLCMYFARILEYVFYLYLIFVGFAFSNVFLDFDITYLKQLPVYLSVVAQLFFGKYLLKMFFKFYCAVFPPLSRPKKKKKMK